MARGRNPSNPYGFCEASAESVILPDGPSRFGSMSALSFFSSILNEYTVAGWLAGWLVGWLAMWSLVVR
jgi:hypothetical protein